MLENLFSECITTKKSNIKVKTLQKYANQCDKITYWCDEMKLISKGDYLSNCPCFLKLVYNSTNSKDIQLDCSQFRNCIFDSISITLDVFNSCSLYKVLGVYEWNSYDLIDFRFYTLDSKTAKQNGYLSDILIHWKARRLQVVSGWKFNIHEFLIQLVWYDVSNSSRFITALNEYYITRFDFRIDFFHKNEIKHLEYSDVFWVNARKNVDNLVIDRHSKKLYTWWTAWNRKDKYIYTRMYQKQIEALDKWCGELYYDYLSYEWKVRRLEFEFLSKFTTARKNITLAGEYLNHELTKQVFEYLWLSEKQWYFSKPKNKIDVPFNFLWLHKKKRVITQTINNISKLHKSWINPFIVVNKAIKECDVSVDNQILESLFENVLYDFDSFDKLMNQIESEKITTKELYDRLFKNQMWIDL